jgi:hypothetical protein
VGREKATSVKKIPAVSLRIPDPLPAMASINAHKTAAQMSRIR